MITTGSSSGSRVLKIALFNVFLKVVKRKVNQEFHVIGVGNGDASKPSQNYGQD
jgi:hypothetical protein